jgi:hypothetical protein
VEKLNILFEEILNEDASQSIKFLKDMNLDPATNPRGKEIFDTINNITHGDGYTPLLIRLRVNENVPYDVLSKIYEYIINNKEYLSKLPIPVANYQTYTDLKFQIDILERQRAVKRFSRQLSPALRQEINNLSVGQRDDFSSVVEDFERLSTDQQRHFMRNVFGYKTLKDLHDNMYYYIRNAQSNQDYFSIIKKIESTSNAFLAYADPEKEIIIAHINSFDASKQLGCTSPWCTTRELGRYNEYKRGGKKYFFLWNMQYDVKNSDHFIAIVYNVNSPELSKAYDQVNNSAFNLQTVLNSEELNIDIFKNYLQTHNIETEKPYGFLNALKTKDTDKIIELIAESEVMQQFNMGEPYINKRYPDEVELGLNEAQMKEMLELSDEYDYIYNTANRGYGDNYNDDLDVNYMHTVLSKKTIKLLINLAKKIGVKPSVYNKFPSEEGAIKSFLEKYDMEKVSETYLGEFGEAQNKSEESAAQELLDEVPFNVIAGTFEIDKMVKYYSDNNLTADNFDDLIEQIKENLPNFSYDSITDARWENIDYGALENNVKEEIIKIIDDIDENPDNEYYKRAKLIEQTNEILEQLGFTPTRSDNIAKRNGKYTSVLVTDTDLVEQEDGESIIMVLARITYYTKNHKEIRTDKIKVPLTSLKNYIDQPQFNLKEELSKIKSMMGLITEAHIKHKWLRVIDNKLQHAKCERCKAEKWWDNGYQQLIYQDRFGKPHYRAPECVLPNTKL